MKFKYLFAYLILTCTLFTHAGSLKSITMNLPELPQGSSEMLLYPGLTKGKKASSSLVCFGDDGRLVYKSYTGNGDKLLDFSVCGFKRSEVPIPDVNTVIHLDPLTGETVPDGTMAYPKGTDSRGYIQSALDKVASRQPDKDGFRGAVLLKKGTYYVNGSLLVPSGVVLRGEGDGSDGTVLIFRNPKGTGIQVGNPDVQPVSTGEPTRITDNYIPAGSMIVSVEDASRFRQGDYINVRKTTNDKWISDLGMDRITEISPNNTRVGNWKARSYQLDHLRRIKEINGNRITLDVQLPQSIAAEHGGGIVEKVSVDGFDSLCGVEALRVVSNYDLSVKSVDDNKNEYFSDEKNNLNSAIDLNCINGWVRDCTVKHVRLSAVRTNENSRFCTIRDCKSLEPVSPISGGRRYPFLIAGNLSLFYNCYAEEGRHTFAGGSRIVGPNAFVRCTGYKSTSISEPHHRWGTGILYDNITLKEGGTLGALNRGYSGSGHGWAGANIVFWNCNAESVVVFDPPTPEQNFAIGYTGEIREEYPTERLEYANDRSGYAGTPKAGVYKGFALMGTGYIESPEGPVAPESLFLQQLIDRIGRERAAKVMNIPEKEISKNKSVKKSECSKDSGTYTLPYIKETNGVKQLIVDGEPFLILGGELMNSSASSIEYMEPIWERVRLLNVNTILLPINWQQFEPVEGDFDYSLIDNHIRRAHENDLRIIILWFGSWKNGRSHYTPNWIKTDMDRFPRMRFKDQIISPTISNSSKECLKADTKAYLQLIGRIKEVDRHNTVIMMQIENEVGLLGGSRDFSPAAQELFDQNVPVELITHINQNINKVKPLIREAYQKNGSKKQGSWEDVFGKSLLTDEMFMAWNYALYINHIAKAGKEVHNIPTFVNAWVAAKDRNLGEYPSGGPNYRMLDIWQAGAPDIDILAVDNYEPYFDEKCNDFVHQGNPLFIPEATAIWKGDTISAGAKAFYTLGHYNAICFSPFGIDHEVYHSDHPLKNAYQMLGNLMPFITEAQTQGRIDAFMEYDESVPKVFALGDYQFTVNYNVKKAPHIKGFGMVIQTDADEFIVAGNAFSLDVESTNTNKPIAQLLSVEEGVFIDGIWHKRRILNGDEFQIKFPAKPYDLVENVVLNEVAVHKVKLFTHDRGSKGENLTPF